MESASHCHELYPFPFRTLVARLVHELKGGESVYGLRQNGWWIPDRDSTLDLSLAHVGSRVGTPLGPASGPHTQLAQNLVLAWLGGSRFHELKTVQVLDDLEIPRPCIYVPHVGYNVEWSQELRVHQSAAEYAKGWLLIHLIPQVRPDLWGSVDTVFDMSLGYDLAGIQGDKVAAFIETMLDAGELLAELKAEVPSDLGIDWDEVGVPNRISGSTTLSTFHGCPADEIEAIATHTMRHHGLHTVVKLNPTLLGYERCRQLLNDRLGYDHIELSPEPFDNDLQWAQLMDMVPRLRQVADETGLELGFKFTNTLVMQSPEPPFGEGEMYLSGAPLHVLALTLADEFRRAVGTDLPTTFSAGVGAKNFADCIVGGLGPVTTCSDLLKSRGYGRLPRYLKALERRMVKAGAINLDALRAAEGGHSDPAQAAATYLRKHAEAVREDAAYTAAKNRRSPKKVGSHLELFDCLTCDLCIPVCPNAANFHFPVALGEYPAGRICWSDGDFSTDDGPPLLVEKRHQIGCTADACNHCGECDVWCPEDGGPYLVKPNLFVSQLAFDDHPERDGFLVSADHQAITWRREGKLHRYERANNGEPAHLHVEGGRVDLENDRPVATSGQGELDLSLPISMRLILEGLDEGAAGTWLSR